MFSPNKKNNINEEIAPDTPEMRSILIRSSPTMMPSSSQMHLPKIPIATTFVSSKTSAATTNWELQTIPKVPELYHVGRSCVTVSNCEEQQITSRISECLRQHSLSVIFDENTAVCETSNHTKFIVKIFEDEEQFIVEVQRRNGCSYTCQKLSRAILRAAKGSKALPESLTHTVPVSILKKEQEQEEVVKVDEEKKKEDINNALHLINQERRDVRMLGMSALIDITAKSHISVENLSFDFISKYILQQPEDDKDNQSKIRLDALTVLANLLEQKSIEAQFVIDNGLLQQLIADLVHNNLHVAFQTARCMVSICRFSPSLKANIAKFGAATVIDQAYEEGVARHKLLETEVKQLKLLTNIE